MKQYSYKTMGFIQIFCGHRWLLCTKFYFNRSSKGRSLWHSL